MPSKKQHADELAGLLVTLPEAAEEKRRSTATPSEREAPPARNTARPDVALRLGAMIPAATPPPSAQLTRRRADEQPAAAVVAERRRLRRRRDCRETRGPWRCGSLAMLAVIFGLSWAQGFLVPLLLGIVIAYTLNPLVAWLETIRIPRAVGTVVVMAGVIAAAVLGTYWLRGQMQTIVEQLPDRGDQVRQWAGAHAHRPDAAICRSCRAQRRRSKRQRLRRPAQPSRANRPLT